MPPKLVGVYAITHRDSGRRYIGSSLDVASRWRHHLRLLRLERHHSPILQRAWTKYGVEAFDFAIVEVCRANELQQREQAWIDWGRAANPEFGFNHLRAAHGRPQLGHTWRVAVTKANNARRTGKALWKRPKKDSPRGKKISAALTGTPHSESRKAKIRLAYSDPAVKAKHREGILRAWERRRAVYGPSGGVAPGRPAI